MEMSARFGACLLIAALACPDTVHAQAPPERGFYLGASTGVARHAPDPGYYASPAADLDFILNDEHWGIGTVAPEVSASGVHLGYRINRYLGVELDVADLGTAKQLFSGVPWPFRACGGARTPFTVPEPVTRCEGSPFGSTVATRRAAFAIVAIAPLTHRIELLGKMGIARTELDGHFYVVQPGVAMPLSEHRYREYDVQPIFGLGVRYRFGAGWAARASWDHFWSRPWVSGVARQPAHPRFAADTDTFWLGIEYHFGAPTRGTAAD